MVIDTSALMAILTGEPDAGVFEQAIDSDAVRLMSAASLLESSIVLESRFGTSGGQELDALVHHLPIDIRGCDREQLEWALYGFRTYGRGRHPARLNFGDCFAYALAKVTGEPLLYKGSDFSQTDITSALPR